MRIALTIGRFRLDLTTDPPDEEPEQEPGPPHTEHIPTPDVLYAEPHIDETIGFRNPTAQTGVTTHGQ